ncbi:hypothetical protein [Psychrobacillus sp. AK 1817]|uniref:hypothetical protein n=1 Tax=Psychrobacillus sp. AK 1817 TaxID=2303505 RepID=UPI00178652FF|nr:hypothetical protein [Psychrobacillus sp. AK 1817]
MERRAATPAGIARAEDPGQSVAKEAAEAVPAESVRSERRLTFLALSLKGKKTVGKTPKFMVFVYSLKDSTM